MDLEAPTQVKIVPIRPNAGNEDGTVSHQERRRLRKEEEGSLPKFTKEEKEANLQEIKDRKKARRAFAKGAAGRRRSAAIEKKREREQETGEGGQQQMYSPQAMEHGEISQAKRRKK
eukprot:PhF_6_TR8297/c0_g1_i1/m.12776